MTASKKASEDRLSELHGAVATVLTTQVLHEEQEVKINAEGELVPTGNTVYTASPATLAAAIKFLKDNNITCDIETHKEMSQLRDKLKEKTLNSRLGNASELARH